MPTSSSPPQSSAVPVTSGLQLNAEYFRDRGYDVSAPEWPRKQGDVQELREATDAIEGLGLAEIVEHYDAQIRALEHLSPRQI